MVSTMTGVGRNRDLRKISDVGRYDHLQTLCTRIVPDFHSQQLPF